MIRIIGAGMAGLLAAAILREECSVVYEKQPTLPNNHHALLRFGTTKVADALHMEFRQVRVIKEVTASRTSIAAHLRYGRKVTGQVSSRSLKAETVERYIAPPDFIERLAAKVMAPIRYDVDYWALASKDRGPIISTMPMPDLMAQLAYDGERPSFQFVPGVTMTAKIKNCDAYCTLYVPDQDELFYRISITGDQLIIEFAYPKKLYGETTMKELFSSPNITGIIDRALYKLGIELDVDLSSVEVHKMRYQKIAPINDDVRKRFMLWATEVHNVYSLGRYATWRPGLMLDDLVWDVRQIRRMIGSNSSYEARK